MDEQMGVEEIRNNLHEKREKENYFLVQGRRRTLVTL